jgi:hypothetical protein
MNLKLRPNERRGRWSRLPTLSGIYFKLYVRPAVNWKVFFL